MGMMIGYDNPLFEPGVSVFTSVGGSTPTELADTVNLFDGRPGTLSTGDLEIGLVQIKAKWSRPIRPRIMMMMNISLSKTVEAEVLLSRPGEGFTYQSIILQPFDLPTGDRVLLMKYPEGLDLCDGVLITFSGVEPGPVSFGQLWISEAAEYGLRPGFANGLTRSGEGVSVNGSLYTFPDSPRRTLDAEIVPQDYDSALLAQDSLQSVAVALSRDPRAVIIPDTDHIAATARYCRVNELGPITGLRNGPYFSMRLRAEEMVGNNGTI